MAKPAAKHQVSIQAKLTTCIFRQWNFPVELPEALRARHIHISSELKQQSAVY
jgi:HD-like signal output (HDOD) protein